MEKSDRKSLNSLHQVLALVLVLFYITQVDKKISDISRVSHVRRNARAACVMRSN